MLALMKHPVTHMATDVHIQGCTVCGHPLPSPPPTPTHTLSQHLLRKVFQVVILSIVSKVRGDLGIHQHHRLMA
jgi:hypothetical protein